MIHTSGDTLEEVENLLQQDVNCIFKWLNQNKLTINARKSFSMVFSSNTNNISTGLSIKIGPDTIECNTTARYLGIYPDASFTWAEHISELCTKLSPKVGLLHKLKSILPAKHVVNVYRTTIQPLIDYCITTWGYAAKKYISKVQHLQNRAARIITGNYSWEINGTELVKQLGWQNIVQRRDYFTAVLVFKALNGIAPDHIQDLFTFARDINLRPTRNTAQNRLYVPKIRKSVYSQSLQYNGAKTWNDLPLTIRNSKTLDTFKRLAKAHFV